MIVVVRRFFVQGFYNLNYILLCFLTSCATEEVGVEQIKEPAPAYSSLELGILELVNNYRVTTGSYELLRLDEISNQARLHNEHMIFTKEVCHHNFGSRYEALVEKVGAKAMGENVAYGYRTSEAFFRAWMKSPNHRKIIEGENTHFGISAKQGEGKIYVTLIFIRK